MNLSCSVLDCSIFKWSSIYIQLQMIFNIKLSQIENISGALFELRSRQYFITAFIRSVAVIVAAF